jgi:translocation and assembly module TamB
MAARQSDEGELSNGTVVVRRRRWRRVAAIASMVFMALFVLLIVGVWVARRPIATEVLRQQFEQSGVRATYTLDRVGLRTQQVSNLVIGDPKNPDLIARHALIQVRWKLNGGVRVYRIVARGVRLKGKVIDGKVNWGEVSKLLPPPTGKPFSLPNVVLDIADSSISLQTPFGRLGFALAGSGNLTGGFRGNLAAVSPKLDMGRCSLDGMRAYTAIRVIARRPRVEGPFIADRFACPVSNLLMDAPRFDLDTNFSESFTSFDGSARVTTQRVIAGANGLAGMTGNVRLTGTPKSAYGKIDVAAQRSRLGPIYADRTRINGKYLIGASAGTLALVANYSAEKADLASSVMASVTEPLSAARNTPIGPIAVSISNAIGNSAKSFDASGSIRMVNFPGGGAARIETANVRADTGAHVQVSGGDGVTYYWPSAKLRIDGLIKMAGGGLPQGQVLLRQPRSGAPMSGMARFAPYQAGASRLALDPIRFQASANGATNFDTVALLDGPFPDGRVQAFRLPLNGQLGPAGAFSVGRGCIVASWRYFKMREIQFGPTRLPVCAMGPAIVSKPAGGDLRVAAKLNDPKLAGHLGKAPLQLRADGAQIIGKQFSAADLVVRLGRAEAPFAFDANRLQGTFSGSGISGTFGGAKSTIGNVPLLITDAEGRWRYFRNDLTVNGALNLSDRSETPRFYTLRSNDFQVKLSGDNINAGGSLVHPASGTKISNVTIRHALSTGSGQAILDVPGITFGEGLQPEEITRLTEGVIALVQGKLSGRGEINWNGEGKVTSTGDFSTAGMDLAAPFGPVTGLSGNVHFTDLLGLETAPGQTASIATINPGILVENGVIRYQLLPGQLVKVERGEWPFMGGRLILRETILNFSRPTAKRLTFEVVGFDAKRFIDTFGFQGIEITGTFDGVLPMIFDENGGRVVGGRLDAREPGGQFNYNGTKPKAGIAVGLAFDLLSNMRYHQMTIRLDGDLAGEFASRFEIGEVSLGNRGGFVAGLVRNAVKKVPLKVNLSVHGPFRALIQMAKGFKDPTSVIQPVLPFPLDTPGLTTETRVLKKEEEQQSNVPPIQEQVDVSTKPQPSE